MRTIAIYPGRFQPFHKGHKSVYDDLVEEYGEDNVFIATTNTTAPITSPFNFFEKREMMKAAGVPEERVIMVTRPYAADEVTWNYDPNSTVVVYALSTKDSDRFSFVDKDGDPTYLQPMRGRLEPFKDHSYIKLVPTIDFEIDGDVIDSATDIRNRYMRADDSERKALIKSLYGHYDKDIKSIFDRRIIVVESAKAAVRAFKRKLHEAFAEGPRQHFAEQVTKIINEEKAVKAIYETTISRDGGEIRIVPDGGIGSHTQDSLASNVSAVLERASRMIKDGDYHAAYYLLYRDGPLQSKLKALDDLEAFINSGN